MALALVGLLPCAAGCGGEEKVEEYPLTFEEGPPPVLAAALAREDLDEQAARERFERVLLLSDAYRASREDPSTEHLEDPDGRAFKTRAALARLWLTEEFEPNHGVDQIPKEAYQSMLPRASGHQVSKLCQVILLPEGLDDEARTARAESDEFRALVEETAEGIAAAVRKYVAKPTSKRPCGVFNQVVRATAGPSDVNIPDGVELRLEGAAMEVCREELWVKPWVDAVCPVKEFSTIGPVWTKFGAHIVTVIEAIPPASTDEAARDRRARELALTSWRIERLQAELERLRQRFDVAVSRELVAH